MRPRYCLDGGNYEGFVFLTIFFAVFCALYAMHKVKAYGVARELNRDYCQKQALRYTWMCRIDLVTKRDKKQDQEQVAYWEKQAKSFVPVHPTQDEQDLFIEHSQDDEIRQLIKDFNFHSHREKLA